MHFFAYHGYYPEERKNGNDFMVNVIIEHPDTQAEQNDELADTLNYEGVYAIVKKEMGITSQLLEHVAGRIKKGVLEKYPAIIDMTVKVSKKNPPMGGNIAWVSIEI